MKRVALTFAMLAAAGLGPALAQTQDPGGAQPRRPLTDQEFAAQAAIGGMAEVSTAQLALQRATSADVKKFAQRMLDDHSKANRELTSLATSKQIALPRTVDQKHRAMADRLARLQGAEFDREYMKGQVKDHKEAVDLFQAEADQGRDADLKAWASRTLPTLKEHLKMARDMAGEKDDSGDQTRPATPKETPKGR
jgi:putative membrane protein